MPENQTKPVYSRMNYFSRFIHLPNKPAEVGYMVLADGLETFDNQEDFEEYLLANAEKVLALTTPQLDHFEWLGERPLGDFISKMPRIQVQNRTKRYGALAMDLFRRNPIMAPFLIILVVGTLFLFTKPSDELSFYAIFALIFGFSYLNPRIQRFATLVTRSNKGRKRLMAYNHFQIWMSLVKIKYHYVLPGILVGIFVLQYLYGFEDSIVEFGLNKPYVFSQNEYWRWITGTFLHGGIIHIYFNAMALIALSGLFLRFASWRWFLATYFLSALGGSIASQYLLPEGISVGASGAILGIFGFVFSLSLRHSSLFPMSFTIRSAINVAFVALYGLVGAAFIDNAGHAGGFIVGGLIGLLPSRESVVNHINQLSYSILDQQREMSQHRDGDNRAITT